jgi:hypothetical protein
LLTTPEEVKLADDQAAAQKSGDVWKWEAKYQNTPNGTQQCAGCSMFVPGFPAPIDRGGYCRKVRSFKGPLGIINPNSWCRFFESSLTDNEVAGWAEKI